MQSLSEGDRRIAKMQADIAGVIERHTRGVADCATPVVGAVLDVWHADHAGHYDNDGSNLVTERSHFRGKLRTDRQGRFELRSILPGRYLNGPTYRPSHVHVKLSARGFAPLTTQLYFEGDPYNERDSFIRRSLVK